MSRALSECTVRPPRAMKACSTRDGEAGGRASRSASETLGRHVRCRGVSLPSGFFLAPVNTGMAVDGMPSARLRAFHRRRAGSGIGLAYVGNIAVGPEYVTNARTLVAPESAGARREYARLASAIERQGTVPGAQIACRLSCDPPSRAWAHPRPLQYIARSRNRLAAISPRELRRLAARFVAAAAILYSVGFTVIQVHAAHGYLLSQLLSRRLNVRSDAFGRQPTLLLEIIVTGIRERLPDALLDVRVNLLDGIEDTADELGHRVELLGRLASLPVDMLSISNGVYDLDKTLIYPPRDRGHACNVPQVAELARRWPTVLWNACGNIWDLEALPAPGPQNLTFGIARSLIADPELVAKSLAGEAGQITRCSGCGECHYYVRGGRRLSCPLAQDLACRGAS